jgi:hypothetical protein
MMFKEGMICFSGPRKGNFIQRGIKFFTRSKFTHSFVVIKGPGEILTALETTSTLVCPTPVARKYNEDHYIEAWEIINENDRQLMLATSNVIYRIYSGCWYGYLSYPWFMYKWLCECFGIEKKTMWKWCRGNITCTELTSKSLADPYKPNQDDNTISPRVLRDHFLKNKNILLRCLGEIETINIKEK